MKKLVILILLFIASKITFSQTFTPFKWSDDKVKFESVEMLVVDDKSKSNIFDGYKDATITINPISDDPKMAIVDVKLSGYFQLESGLVNTFKYDEDDKWQTITYLVESGTKLCTVLIQYKSGEKKPAFIIVSTNADYSNKASKKLTFTLKGIE